MDNIKIPKVISHREIPYNQMYIQIKALIKRQLELYERNNVLRDMFDSGKIKYFKVKDAFADSKMRIKAFNNILKNLLGRKIISKNEYKEMKGKFDLEQNGEIDYYARSSITEGVLNIDL